MDISLNRYNIRNLRNEGIKLVLRSMDQANMDLGVLFDKNITGGVYTRRSLDYNVTVLEASSNYQGGI